MTRKGSKKMRRSQTCEKNTFNNFKDFTHINKRKMSYISNWVDERLGDKSSQRIFIDLKIDKRIIDNNVRSNFLGFKCGNG